MDEEFHDWAMNKNLVLGSTAYYTAKQAWIEATRRADRKARLECAAICGRVWVQQAEGIAAARSCQEAIRATIPEE